MESHIYRCLSVKTSFLFFCFLALFGLSPVVATAQNDQEVNVNKQLSLKEKVTLIEPASQKLLPMPLGQLKEAAKKVRSTRDPFQNTPGIESNNLEVLQSALRLKGIIKSENNLLAMIKTTKGQGFYKVGDSLGNGFFIKGISSKDVTVDISNGYRFYRLSLYSLNK